MSSPWSGPALSLTQAVDIPATSSTKDSFGRIRTSGLIKQAYGTFEYGLNSYFIESKVSGTGTVTSNTDQCAVVLRTGGTATGALARAQTRAFQRYTPGNSKLTKQTGCFAAPTAGVRQRIGRFCNTDGLFLEWDGPDLYFVRRTSTSGTPVDNRTPRASWYDKFDGAGPSGINFDFAGGTSWLEWMDLEWLGVGRYRLGFASPTDGSFLPAVIGSGTNSLTVPYMRTANLPIRYEIENTGATGADVSMKWFCYSDDDEGAEESDIPLQFPIDNGTTPQALANGTYRPILAIRAKTTGPNSRVNRAQIILKAVQAAVSGNTLSHFRIIYNPTALVQNGGAVTWISASALAEYATFSAGAADTITGGTAIGDSFYVAASATIKGGGDAKLFRKLPLVYTELGSVQDTIVLVGAGVGATSAALGEISYQELY